MNFGVEQSESGGQRKKQAAHRLFEKLQRTGTAQGGADLVISDQRRAFCDEYENKLLLECDCFAEISGNNNLSEKEYLTLADLRRTSCILIAPPEQRDGEAGYYRDTPGFGGNFLYAGNLEEGRLMTPGNRGFLPLENIGTMPPAVPTIILKNLQIPCTS